MFQVEELKKALEDKAFAEEYSKAESVKEAVAVLAKKGLECTEEEFDAVFKGVKTLAANGGELSDESLQTVAGGMVQFNFNFDETVFKFYNEPKFLFPQKLTIDIKFNN